MPITKRTATKQVKPDNKVSIKQAINPDIDDNEVIDTSVINPATSATPTKSVPKKKATKTPSTSATKTPSTPATSANLFPKPAKRTTTSYNNFIRVELIRLTKDKDLSAEERRNLFKETASRWSKLTEEQKAKFSTASLASGGSK